VSFARQRHGCLVINRQCIQALRCTTKEKEERSKKESDPTKLRGISERVNEIFYHINREIPNYSPISRERL